MKNIFIGLLSSFILFSCGDNINVNDNLLNTITQITEQSIEQGNNLTESINGIKTKVSFLKHDPQAKRQAIKVEPILTQLNKTCNELDDYILYELSSLLLKTENQQWFFKGVQTQITSYTDLNSLKNKESYSEVNNWQKGSDDKNTLEKKLIKKTNKLRDNVILITFGRIKERGREYILPKHILKNKTTLENFLLEKKHPRQYEILNIYQTLSFKHVLKKNERYIDANEVRLKNQPVIGVIANLTSLRNKIKEAQFKAGQSLLYQIDMPILRVNKVEPLVVGNNKPITHNSQQKVKLRMVAYDSTTPYTIRYKFNNNGEYIKKTDGEIILDTKKKGLNHIEGTMQIELAGKLKEKNWSYEYIVSE